MFGKIFCYCRWYASPCRWPDFTSQVTQHLQKRIIFVSFLMEFCKYQRRIEKTNPNKPLGVSSLSTSKLSLVGFQIPTTEYPLNVPSYPIEFCNNRHHSNSSVTEQFSLLQCNRGNIGNIVMMQPANYTNNFLELPVIFSQCSH